MKLRNSVESNMPDSDMHVKYNIYTTPDSDATSTKYHYMESVTT